MKVKVINKSQNPLPKYATKKSACLDLYADLKGINQDFFQYAAIDEERDVLLIFSGGKALIPTNLYMQVPEGFELQVRPRSGLALKNTVTVLNTPGCVDEDYRGNVGVILINHSDDVFEVKTGDRIAQAGLQRYEQIEWEEVESLDETERGEGGFGHSGK